MTRRLFEHHMEDTEIGEMAIKTVTYHTTNVQQRIWQISVRWGARLPPMCLVLEPDFQMIFSSMQTFLIPKGRIQSRNPHWLCDGFYHKFTN